MRRALSLAARGSTSPNPMVGAVVVKDGEIVAEGFHPHVGAPHAEVIALRKAGEAAGGADLFVTLEPCCHHGRTPPCVESVISAGIGRVFVAMVDPNPKVAGKGLAALQNSGIKVHVGLLEEDARRLNQAFIKYVTEDMPFVTLKMAMTLDGKIATRTGDSKWISCDASRRYVHRLRARSDAVAVGIGTLLCDDPELTARGVRCLRQPNRVVIDALARTPLDARVLNSVGGEVIVATLFDAPSDRLKKLELAGARILTVGRGPLVDPRRLVQKLGEQGVTSLLIEGGGEFAASAIESKVVDKVLFFLAPKIIGGREAKTPVEGLGAAAVADGLELADVSLRRFGCDIAVEAYPRYRQ